MISNKPLVSIVIPCYNHENFVQDCIQSVIEQTYENIELIVIDDGSKDNSVLKIQELIPQCKERFVRFEFRNRPNKGLSATLNEALEWVKGKYISCIASDDMLIECKTSLQVDFLERNPEIVAVFGGYTLIDDKGCQLSFHKGSNMSYTFKDIILLNSNLPAPTQMIRTSAMFKTGGYNPDFLIEDWYMWLQLSSIGRLHSMENIVSLYRFHANNTSKNLDKMYEMRLTILSHYKDSKYYAKAVNRIKWLHAAELLYFKNDGKIKNYFRMLHFDAGRTLTRTAKKVIGYFG